jgi:hypothetical protein
MFVLLVGMAAALALCVVGIAYVVITDAPERGPRRPEDNLYAAGLVMMVVFPLGGFIAGCALLPKRAWNGAGIMLVSVLAAGVYGTLGVALLG